MRVLIIEQEPGAGDPVAANLEDAGHGTSRCHEPGSTAFACKGMADQAGCPLEHGSIDLAVVARGPSGGPAAEEEAGVRCAVRRRIPVMVVGSAQGASFEGWTTDVVAPDDAQLVQRAVAAANLGLTPYVDKAEQVARQALAKIGVPDSAVTASVVRDGQRMRVSVTVDADLDPAHCETTGVRVAGAIREMDPWTTTIDVKVGR